MLRIEKYNQYLSQSGIDFCNGIISEINYSVNQYRQAHKEINAKNLPFLPSLFKQILSDREGVFAISAFQNDAELYEALKQFVHQGEQSEILGEKVNLFASLRRVFAMLGDNNELFVSSAELDRISHCTTGRWDLFRDTASEYAEQKFPRKKDYEEYVKQAAYSFSEIKAWNVRRCLDDETTERVRLTDFWKGKDVEDLFQKEEKMRSAVLTVAGKQDEIPLRERKEDVSVIKDYLDTVNELLNRLKPLNVSPEYGGDLNLQGMLAEHYNVLQTVIPLYNQVRNYLTKKITETPKIKLMFGNPTLADGWDLNKEKDNTSVLLFKDNKYFLGIMNPKSKVDFEKLSMSGNGAYYEKMVYKLLPGPNKMLPKVFFSKKNSSLFKPSPELLRRYENGEHLKGNRFDKAFCHELINFFKLCIAKHEDWARFHFRFTETSKYEGIDEFYREIADQGYHISFNRIPENTVDRLVEEGKLYLFQIWNKDFAEGAHGRQNKSTLYWKALFDEQNLSDVVFKLNGEAELFLREPSIKEDKPTHRKGEKMLNRTIVTDIQQDGNAVRRPIEERLYSELFRYVNGRLNEPLSKEASALLEKRLDWRKGMKLEDTKDKLVVKDVVFELTKDKRFTTRKYFFHVPFSINFKAPDLPKKFNDSVLEFLRKNPDVNIIGIDRGERHLIYLMLIDRNGKILEQKSFNIMNGVDYHAKLDQRENERQEARKSWMEIGKIKDLKAGYLSGVVHEIVKLMIEHNAIVVMEDLNFGFKRGRMKIEKQVYQKFEKALIEKLNYLVFKDAADPKAPGGVLNGYQLTNKFESFAKLGKQNGFLFYVPAAYTSKIDPATGFVNLFDTTKCTNAESRKEFFEKFDSIRYEEKRKSFAFSFDYKNFKTVQNSWKTDWTVYSAKSRLVFNATKKTQEEIFPTEKIIDALRARGVSVADGFDLKAYLHSVEPDHASASLFSDVFYAFDKTLQMRNSRTGSDVDYIESPVLNDSGSFFDSRTVDADRSMPQDADANGAYHIALKGLLLLTDMIDRDGTIKRIEHKDWFEFVQNRHR